MAQAILAPSRIAYAEAFHARRLVFQLAEVGVPLVLFQGADDLKVFACSAPIHHICRDAALAQRFDHAVPAPGPMPLIKRGSAIEATN